MARRPRSRTSRAFPKTLTGILASIALALAEGAMLERHDVAFVEE